MTPKEHLIEALRALCLKHGTETVADETESSLENLKQILAGTKLPSGSPRGVGPNLQKRLSARYPGWEKIGTSSSPASATLQTALEVLGAALAHRMPSDVREDIADALSKLARREGKYRDQEEVLRLIEQRAQKRTGT